MLLMSPLQLLLLSLAAVATQCLALAAMLTLDDGTQWDGVPFGAPLSSAAPLPTGEVVYSTAMTGYVEMLTDPSYTGQILVLTFPLIGNHGVPRNDTAPPGLEPRDPRGWPQFEGRRIAVAGLVVSSAVVSSAAHHWEAHQSLGEWLRASGVPGLTGVDTRGLVTHIRNALGGDRSLMAGLLSCGPGPAMPRMVPPHPGFGGPQGGSYRLVEGKGELVVALLDCGSKGSIARRTPVPTLTSPSPLIPP